MYKTQIRSDCVLGIVDDRYALCGCSSKLLVVRQGSGVMRDLVTMLYCLVNVGVRMHKSYPTYLICKHNLWRVPDINADVFNILKLSLVGYDSFDLLRQRLAQNQESEL